MKIIPKDVIIRSGQAIRDAMAMLNHRGRTTKTLFVTDNNDILIGSLTDGDIRRAFLNGFSMDSPVDDICKRDPIVVPDGMPDESMTQLLKINHKNSNICDLPVVDSAGKIIAVKTLDHDHEIVSGLHTAVIMAGGEGIRLRPLTENVPKPMLTVGGKPLLQILIESLREAGFRKIIINIRYLGEVIQDYFKDGSAFDVDISYIEEPFPLGTAGSLSLIPAQERPVYPFPVINGDLLTTLNFKSFCEFHVAAQYDFTLCGRPYKVQVPFGYPVVEGDIVTAFKEKPVFNFLVNSGIYCLSPELIDKIPENQYFDMPDLIKEAIADNKRVGVFPLREEFHEIGHVQSYQKAEEFYKTHFVGKEML